MKSYASAGEIARGCDHRLAPQRRGIVVLKAYFDDSVTHENSKAVVLA